MYKENKTRALITQEFITIVKYDLYLIEKNIFLNFTSTYLKKRKEKKSFFFFEIVYVRVAHKLLAIKS